MTKLTKVLFSLMVVILLAAGCGDQKQKTEDQEVSADVEPEKISKEESEKQKEFYHAKTDRESSCYYGEDQETPLLWINTSELSITGTGYENLQQAVEQWSIQQASLFREREEVLKEEAEKAFAKSPQEFYGYEITQEIEIMRMDEKIFSFYEQCSTNTDYASPGIYWKSANFDAVTGKELELEDLLEDFQGFQEEAEAYIIYVLENTYGSSLYDGLEETLEQMWQWGPEWYLDASGIVFVFSEYSVVSESFGIPKIVLSYENFGPYMKSEYLLTGDTGVLYLPIDQQVYLNLPTVANGISLMIKSAETEYGVQNWLVAGNQEVQIGEELPLRSVYVIQKKEKTYVVLDGDMASEDYVTYLYDLSQGIPVLTDQIYGAIERDQINTDTLGVEFSLQVLGSYRARKNYAIDQEGKFTSAEEWYQVIGLKSVLVTVRDLPVEIDGQIQQIPAGTHIYLEASDNQKKAMIYIEGLDKTGILYYTSGEEDGWPLYIEGIPEEEYFEMLWYAG